MNIKIISLFIGLTLGTQSFCMNDNRDDESYNPESKSFEDDSVDHSPQKTRKKIQKRKKISEDITGLGDTFIEDLKSWKLKSTSYNGNRSFNIKRLDALVKILITKKSGSNIKLSSLLNVVCLDNKAISNNPLKIMMRFLYDKGYIGLKSEQFSLKWGLTLTNEQLENLKIISKKLSNVENCDVRKSRKLNNKKIPSDKNKNSPIKNKKVDEKSVVGNDENNFYFLINFNINSFNDNTNIIKHANHIKQENINYNDETVDNVVINNEDALYDNINLDDLFDEDFDFDNYLNFENYFNFDK